MNPVPRFETAVTTDSVAETLALGAAFGGALAGRPAGRGAVLLLSGELGAGKTAFVQGLAAGLGCTVPPRSPTFALLLSYPVRRGELHHLDLYRLKGEVDFEELGLVDLFHGPDVVALEWPERLGAEAPPHGLLVRFDTTGDSARRVTLAGAAALWRLPVETALSGWKELRRAHAGH